VTEFATIGDRPSESPVVLVPQAGYHLEEIAPLADELRRRGVPAQIVTPIAPLKPLRRFRPGTKRYEGLMAAASETEHDIESFDSVVSRARALVVMNDWGVTRSLVEALNRRGAPTFGLVEGVQDFDDVDTGRKRLPYRTVSNVFCLGDFDASRLIGCDTTIVGSTRLRRLLGQARSDQPRSAAATINSNFTYGVFTDIRRKWLSEAVLGCTDSATPWILSRHEAERGLSRHRSERTRSIGELLDGSSHLISRFSTVCYEALIRGCHLVYFNPHGEQVGTFAPVDGAITICGSHRDLVDALNQPINSAAVTRDAATDFLFGHLRLGPGAEPAYLAADVIEGRL
jgi:hypothetical protein